VRRAITARGDDTPGSASGRGLEDSESLSERRNELDAALTALAKSAGEFIEAAVKRAGSSVPMQGGYDDEAGD
jgi:hypothetical protein